MQHQARTHDWHKLRRCEADPRDRASACYFAARSHQTHALDGVVMDGCSKGSVHRGRARGRTLELRSSSLSSRMVANESRRGSLYGSLGNLQRSECHVSRRELTRASCRDAFTPILPTSCVFFVNFARPPHLLTTHHSPPCTRVQWVEHHAHDSMRARRPNFQRLLIFVSKYMLQMRAHVQHRERSPAAIRLACVSQFRIAGHGPLVVRACAVWPPRRSLGPAA